jgi:hypothetical protein
MMRQFRLFITLVERERTIRSMKTVKKKEQLLLEQLQDIQTVRMWKEDTGCTIEKMFMKAASKAATEVAAAAARQKSGCEALLEETIASSMHMEQRGATIS